LHFWVLARLLIVALWELEGTVISGLPSSLRLFGPCSKTMAAMVHRTSPQNETPVANTPAQTNNLKLILKSTSALPAQSLWIQLQSFNLVAAEWS
jgi:hypothetical protein